MRYRHVDSPLGPILLAGDTNGLRHVTLSQDGAATEPHADWQPAYGGELDEAARQLEKYFEGKLKSFALKLNPEGTAFQRRVWEELGRIPYGQTRTYGEVAEAIGQPSAMRAVGGASGANPLPVVIPCHRVLGSDGSLTGFTAGLANKEALLKLEGVLL